MLPEREEVNHKRTTPKYKRIPFPPAAKYEHAGVLKVLLERAGITPDQVDTEHAKGHFCVPGVGSRDCFGAEGCPHRYRRTQDN